MISAVSDNQTASESTQRAICDTLFEVFDVSFTLSPGSRRNDRNEDDNCVEILHQNQWRVTLKRIDDAGLWNATGIVTSPDRATLNRLIRCARQLIQQTHSLNEYEEQLECFMRQVTSDLEEIAWLRGLAETIGSAPVDQSLQNVCETVLPRLKELLRARAVLFIRDEKDPSTRVCFRRPIACAGDDASVFDLQDSAIALIDRFASSALRGPVIRNVDFEAECEIAPGSLPEKVASMVLVRAATASRHCGWLIAINRVEDAADSPGPHFSEAEFGTYEATLMETAAVILATHAGNRELIRRQEQTLVGVVRAMVNSLDARDRYTCGHSDRVARVSRLIARTLNLSERECREIYLAGLLHDIGKIGVADSVLLKNGPLDDDERRQIEQHTAIGYAILEPVEQLRQVLPGVLHHHERFDGKGYPHRLQGKDIPLAGRILAVADAYDAMTTSRPYRVAMPIIRAERILKEGAGTHWDEDVIAAFFKAREQIRSICQQTDSCDDMMESEPILQYARLEDDSFAGLFSSDEYSTE